MIVGAAAGAAVRLCRDVIVDTGVPEGKFNVSGLAL